MIKFLWFVFKYTTLFPITVTALYFGLLMPASKRLSLFELSEPAVDGFAAFSAFGDFTARYITVYRGYYNAWLPEEAEIKPIKTHDTPSI